MLPLIHDGSELSYIPLSAGEVEPGDVVVLQGEDRLVAHRLIRKEREGDGWRLLEKGDHQFLGMWTDGDALIGKAVEIRAGSTVRSLVSSPSSLRVRALRAWSDFENRSTSAYVRLRDSAGPLKWIRYPALLLGIVLLPVRWLVYRSLMTVYSVRRVDEPDQWKTALDLFRLLRDEDPYLSEDAPSLEGGIDLLRQMGPHGLTPLGAAIFCDASEPSPVSAEVLSLMKQARYRVALAHMSSVKLVKNIAPKLSREDIEYAVIKGPILHEEFYSDLFGRTYGDVDIVVGARDVDRALGVLIKEGYEVVGGKLNNWLLRVGHFHLALDAPGKGTPRVELHWCLLDRANLYRIDNAAALGRARTVMIDGVDVKTLSAEDEFVYLCAHIVKHAVMNGLGVRTGQSAEWFCRPVTGNRLLWFCDVFLLLAKSGDRLDWGTVKERMEEWNVSDEVAEVLAVLGLLLPDSEVVADASSRLSGAADESRLSDRFLKTAWGQRLIEALLPMSKAFLFRPVRLLSLGRLLFPSPQHLLRYHRATGRWKLAILYVWHPIHMLLKILGVVSQP